MPQLNVKLDSNKNAQKPDLGANIIPNSVHERTETADVLVLFGTFFEAASGRRLGPKNQNEFTQQTISVSLVVCTYAFVAAYVLSSK